MRKQTHNDSAVSNIIGAVILFGFVITLIVIFQVTAVPIWNQNVEFEHNQRVQGDVGMLHDNIVLSSTTGRSTTQSVELGTQYPNRVLFVNPSNPSGRVSTLEQGDVTVENVESSDGDVGDYWDGTAQVFDTRSVEYVTDYNEYGNAPRTVVDNMVLFNEVGDAQARISAQNVISDRNINLNLVTGEISKSGVRPASVNIDPVSAPSQRVSVTNSTDSPVTLTLPTLLSEERWLETLENEHVENGGHIAEVTYTEGEPYNELTLVMEENIEYNLRMSKVALGQRDESQEPHYIILEGDNDRSVVTGGAETLNVEVRDRYNNPISGVKVNATLEGDGEVLTIQPTTNVDGVAEFRYVAPTQEGTAGIELSILENDVARERVNVAVEVVEEGETGTGGVDFDQGEKSGVFVAGVERLRGGSSNEANIDFRNTDTTKDVTAVRFISFYSSRNCPCANRVRIASTEPVLEEAGPIRTLNTPIELPAGSTTTLNFDFSSTGGGGGFSVRSQDFAFFRFEFSDGTESTYLVQLQSN